MRLRLARPTARPLAQAVLLLGFLYLFAVTAYRGQDVLNWPVHLVFRLDPLAWLAEFFAVGAEAFHWGWLAAVLMVVATVLLGRFFCGWMCPLGTVLDLTRIGLRKLFRVRSRRRRPPAWTGPALLAGLLAATLLGLPLLGVFDPLSLLLRSLTLTLHPWFDQALKNVLASAEITGWPVVSSGAAAAYDHLSKWLLAFGEPAFLLAGISGLCFAAILLLERWAPRFWCTHLCPLGTLLGLAARFSPLRRSRSGAEAPCGACSACERRCPTGAAAIDPADPALCIQCDRCVEACPREARRPHLSRPGLQVPQPATRRALLTSMAGGALLAAVPSIRAEERELGWSFLRPPGAKDEEEFQKRCIRCGACMRVCPRGALHPTLLQAGLGGMWTPRLVPRIGYCEYHCRLCGQVCPTGAIGYLEEGEKETVVIGIAVFDVNRCLPYRKAQDCMVCEEHCPTNPKAIEFRTETRIDPLGVKRQVKIPYVVEERCIGCGICENRCPVPGRSAILTTRERPQDLSSFY